MKLNYKNTALGMLDDPASFRYYIPDPAAPMTNEAKKEFGTSIRNAMISNGSIFKNKIRFVSNTLLEAYNKGKSKLVSVFDKVDIEEAGTLIIQKGSYTNTYFYALKCGPGPNDEWNVKLLLTVFNKHTQSEIPGLDACITLTNDSHKEFIWKGYKDQGFDGGTFMSFIISLIVFLRYCELETKVISGNRKDLHAGVKYVNETKHNIEILDSTWFTTIIRSEGFAVGGHFRMQPYGPGLAHRKLIWISPFEKHGYTRTAKMLNDKINTNE